MPVTAMELVVRVVVALLLGAALGAERETNQKTAGLRTHTLVAAGVVSFTISAAFAFDGSDVDPTRVAVQIVTGIGFVGTGGTIRTGLTV